LCNGAPVSRTTFNKLYSNIGDTYGNGDGSTTFNLPDFRGAFLRGAGTNGSRTMANGSNYAGPSIASYENDQFQHVLAYNNSATGNGNHHGNGSGGFYAYNIPWNHSYSGQWKAQGWTAAGYGNARTGDETRPFNYGVNYCIRYI
jgi:microcystin-dependent protein